MKFRKKPIVIEAEEALQLMLDAENNWEALPVWIRDAYDSGVVFFGNDHMLIRTLEGAMRADPGDFVIQGVMGELYPCKADVFWATYEIESL